MRAVFFGLGPGVGTSANMQLAALGTDFYSSFYAGENREQVQFIDCRWQDGREVFRQTCDKDLLVANISLTPFGLEEFFLNHSIVHKNIIFLIGKYHRNSKEELQYLSRQYRIPLGRICSIPYSQRFKLAYENGHILEYLNWQQQTPTYENWVFGQSLRELLFAIAKYKNRKGEIYYG